MCEHVGVSWMCVSLLHCQLAYCVNLLNEGCDYVRMFKLFLFNIWWETIAQTPSSVYSAVSLPQHGSLNLFQLDKASRDASQKLLLFQERGAEWWVELLVCCIRKTFALFSLWADQIFFSGIKILNVSNIRDSQTNTKLNKRSNDF